MQDSSSDNAPLVDTHAHLDSEEYDADRVAVVDRAFSAGIDSIVTVGFERRRWSKTVQIAKAHPAVYAALGIHPNSAGEASEENLACLEELCRETMGKRVVAIGETGLDYYRDFVSPEKQRESFCAHLDLARNLNLPVIIHNRDAHADILRILREDGRGTRGVMHSFSGDLQFAQSCIKLGYYISLAGPVTFRNASDKHLIARSLPLSQMLVETDSPYLAPEPHRGRRNEPSYVVHTARAIASLRGVPLEEVAVQTTANARALFGFRGEVGNRKSAFPVNRSKADF